MGRTSQWEPLPLVVSWLEDGKSLKRRKEFLWIPFRRRRAIPAGVYPTISVTLWEVEWGAPTSSQLLNMRNWVLTLKDHMYGAEGRLWRMKGWGWAFETMQPWEGNSWSSKWGWWLGPCCSVFSSACASVWNKIGVEQYEAGEIRELKFLGNVGESIGIYQTSATARGIPVISFFFPKREIRTCVV